MLDSHRVKANFYSFPTPVKESTTKRQNKEQGGRRSAEKFFHLAIGADRGRDRFDAGERVVLYIKKERKNTKKECASVPPYLYLGLAIVVRARVVFFVSFKEMGLVVEIVDDQWSLVVSDAEEVSLHVVPSQLNYGFT